MNFKTTLVLLVLLVVAGVAVFFTRERGGDAATRETSAERKLIDVKSEDVIKVTVAPAAGEKFTLEKTGGNWQMTEPVKGPTERFEVDSLVNDVVSVRSRGGVGSDASPDATGLNAPTYRVELTAAGGKTYTLNVGNKSAVGDHLYVSTGGETQAEMVDASLYDQLEKPFSDYRRKQLVDVPTSEVKQVTVAKGDGKLVLEKHGEQWQVVAPEKMPAEKSDVDDIIMAATGMRVVEFVSEDPADASKYALNTPRLAITLDTAAPSTQPTTASTQPTAATIRIGRYDDIRQKNVYVTASGAPTIAKVAATILERFDKKPIDLRERKVLDIKPEQVTRIHVTSDLPATTQPTTREAKKTQLVLERRPAPATQPATAPATTQASTQPSTTQAATQPTSQWQLASDPKGPANDSRVRTLLLSLNPLRAEKYVEPPATAPTTKPADGYVLTITTGGTGVMPEKTYEIRLRDGGSGQPVLGEYNGLAFEVDRSLISQIGGDFTWKPAPAAPEPSEMPDGFPGTFPPPDPSGP